MQSLRPFVLSGGGARGFAHLGVFFLGLSSYSSVKYFKSRLNGMFLR